jgi:hypothetical protein
MGGILDWLLKQGSDELAAQSSQHKGGITDWVLKKGLDELAAQSSRQADIKDVDGSFWIYRYDSYEEAVKYLDTIKEKYNKDKIDYGMNRALENGYIYAKSYFRKEQK